MRLALYQPDIPQNTGAILRLAACMKTGVDIIEPCGFIFSDRKFKRAGMDYIDAMDIIRHPTWEAFKSAAPGRIVLLTTKADHRYTDFAFQADDTLLLGRESKGVPDTVHQDVDARILIPMAPNMRSLNIAVSAAMVLGEALRQTHLFETPALSQQLG